jgi:hypothetical protein
MGSGSHTENGVPTCEQLISPHTATKVSMTKDHHKEETIEISDILIYSRTNAIIRPEHQSHTMSNQCNHPSKTSATQ